MTNAEKYTTTEDRVTAFRKFCHRQKGCDKCSASRDQSKSKCTFGFDWCALAWLAREAENAKPKEEELKPCPFCGSKAKLAYTTEGEKRARVSCSKCHAEVLIDGRVMSWLSVNEMVDTAITEWNLRVQS